MIKDTKQNYTLNVVCRWVVGLVFLFSSIVKGVDPLGTAYKIEEYMTAWELFGMNFEWAVPLAGVLSVALVCAEFLMGLLLVTNSFRLLSAWGLVVMMVFFTVTTLIDALTNKVSDCGCFGDAVRLTNWQTFLKNVALDVPTVWIFLTRWLRYRHRFERDWIVCLAGLAVMLVFCIYNIKHEPIIDFRPWKVGNRMIAEHEAMNHMTFRNMTTGEEVTVDYPNGGWDQVPAEYKDFSVWEVTGSTSDAPFEVMADGFSMMDLDGEDHAAELLPAEDGLVIITIHDLIKTGPKGAIEMKRARKQAKENGTKIVVLTSVLPEDIQAWLYMHQMETMEYYFADATAIKAMMRGNPGFLYIKDGTVVSKGRKAEEVEN